MSGSRYSSVFGKLCSLPGRRPWTLILASTVLAAFGGYVYFGELEIQSGRTQLSKLDTPLTQRFEAYREAFGVKETVVLVIAHGDPEQALQAEPPGPAARDEMKQVARRWAERLRGRPDLFPDVVERVTLDGPYALLYLSVAQLDAAAQAVAAFRRDLASWAEEPTLEALFGLVAERLRDPGTGSVDESGAEMALGFAEEFFLWFRGEITAEEGAGDLLPALTGSLGTGDFDAEGYLFAAGGRLLLVPATVQGDPGHPNEYGEAIGFAGRAAEDSVAGTGDEGSVRAGLAGLPALEKEEMETSQGDFTRSAVIALVLVSGLFIWAFRTLVPPVLAALCLCLAIGLTFVFTWAVIGHLNLVSMVFSIILIVLGIDFAIHIATHYERALGQGAEPGEGIRSTLQRIGSPLWVSGLTTSVAFLSGGLTETPALSELGIIAGGGLMICLLVMFLVYPAMLYLVDRRRDLSEPAGQNAVDLPKEHLPGSWMRAAVVAAVVLAVLGYAQGQYRFDTNLLAMQPKTGEAAYWQQILLRADDRTQFAIAVHTERESLERVRDRLESSDLVRATESVFPGQEDDKRRILLGMAAELRQVEFGSSPVPSPTGVRRALFGIRQSLRRLSLATPDAERALQPVIGEVDLAYRYLNELPEAEAVSRLEAVQGRVVDAARSGVIELKSLCSPPPFEVERAPEAMRELFVGRSGELALLVYPEENTWDRSALDRFVDAAVALEPDLFGGAVMFQDDSRTLIRSFATASIYALLAVVAMVLTWCRSLRQTLLVLFPLITSGGLLLGVMRWAPWTVSWNFANFFALPILIGIGVDSGIHLTQAWDRGAETFRLARRAVLVSALTTLIGFGILSASRHVGVRSLGIVVTMGVALIALTSLVLLPVILQWGGRTAAGRVR